MATSTISSSDSPVLDSERHRLIGPPRTGNAKHETHSNDIGSAPPTPAAARAARRGRTHVFTRDKALRASLISRAA